MDPVKGVGPSTNAWKALVLPLNYTEMGCRRFLKENHQNSKSFIFTCTHNYVLVPATGLEPVRARTHEILSLGCLPIPPRRHVPTRLVF